MSKNSFTGPIPFTVDNRAQKRRKKDRINVPALEKQASQASRSAPADGSSLHSGSRTGTPTAATTIPIVATNADQQAWGPGWSYDDAMDYEASGSGANLPPNRSDRALQLKKGWNNVTERLYLGYLKSLRLPNGMLHIIGFHCGLLHRRIHLTHGLQGPFVLNANLPILLLRQCVVFNAVRASFSVGNAWKSCMETTTTLIVQKNSHLTPDSSMGFN